MILSTLALIAVLQEPIAPTPTRAAIERAITPVMTASKIPGVVIAMVRGDSIVRLESFGVRDVATKQPMRTTDLFMIGSVTKPFTATLIAMLVAEKRLVLEAPVRQYLDTARALPEWTSRVTIRQLANHTSGLPRNPANRRNEPNSPSVMMAYTRGELYAGLHSTTLISPPGAAWSYSNLGFALLGEVIERVTGMTYERALQGRIATPLGMQSTGVVAPPSLHARFASGYWPDTFALVARPRWNAGEVASFAGMYSSANDLARFLAAMTNASGRTPFSLSVRTLMQSPTVRLPGSDGAQMSVAWFVDSLADGLRLYGAPGDVDSFSSSIAFSLRPRAGLVVLVNRGGEAANAIYDALLPVFVGMLGR